MGPNYACLFPEYVEHSLFQSYSGPDPQVFLRYITSATSMSRPELEKFIGFASNFHPTLIFTWSISDSSHPFLDITVSVSGDRLVTNIYYKCAFRMDHSFQDNLVHSSFTLNTPLWHLPLQLQK
eukprot:g45667.t1